MRVEVVLTETDIAQEFAEAMEARDLPEKFFFWFPRSAAKWTELAQRDDLYGDLNATWKEIAAAAGPLSQYFGQRMPVISFGSGDGSRDRLLLTALKDIGCECLYFPVDASQSMLEAACAGADDEDIETIGIKADISSPVHLVYAADAAEPPRLFIMSANTLGAFDPLAEIRYIAQCLKPEDRLIIDGEIFEEGKSLELRNNTAVHSFIWALLASAGIGPDDGEIRFELKRDDRHEGLHLITRHFRAERDLTANVAGQRIPVQRGERIGLNFQYLYTPEAFEWLLKEHGGLEISMRFGNAGDRFITALCRK